MKNATQLKAIVRNISKEKKISAQLVLQNHMLERLLERIALSQYKDNFILKGGFLIASMVGLDTRATMDMDVTIKGEAVNPENIRLMFDEIIKISVDDDISFEFKNINEIREGDDYTVIDEDGLERVLNGQKPDAAKLHLQNYMFRF